MSTKHAQGISRRSFLAGTALASTGAVLGLAGCAPKENKGAEEANAETGSTSSDWLGSEPTVQESDIVETIDTEFLIVGAGTGGLFAACAAGEEGIETFVLEKYNGGVVRDDVGGVNSRLQQESGYTMDLQEYLLDMNHYAAGQCNLNLHKTWYEKSGETIDWYETVLDQYGVKLWHEAAEEKHETNYKHWATGHSPAWPEDGSLNGFTVLSDYAEKTGHVTFRYNTPMVKLVVEGDKVVGAIGKGENGYIQVNASKGVLVSTGGYGINVDMQKALQPHTTSLYGFNSAQPGCEGDGIKACLWAGAKMDDTHSSMLFDRGGLPADSLGGADCGVGALFWMGSQPWLKVNLNGERFCNESGTYDFVLHSDAQQPGSIHVTLWDADFATYAEQFDMHGCSRLFPFDNGAAPNIPIQAVMGMNEELAAKGYIQKADTLEELAGKLGLPADALIATVERNNENYDNQVDPDFGKEPFRLSPVRNPPFYGIRNTGMLLCTMDGININTQGQALRADGSVGSDIRRKISTFCNVKPECVIENLTMPSLYQCPLMLHTNGLDDVVVEKLKLDVPPADLTEWKQVVSRIATRSKTCTIALVGKYVKLHDAYLSVMESLYHAGFENDSQVEIKWVESEDLTDQNACKELFADVDGIIVPGGFGDRGIEGMIQAAQYARENNVPYFGICLGMQIMVMEFARGVLGYADANSSEFTPDGKHNVIALMADQQGNIPKGGTMRLGKYPCTVAPGTKMAECYGQTEIWERHRHRYEFNNDFRQEMQDAGLVISGTSPDGRLVETVELPGRAFHLGAQFHPEFKSRPNRAHPLFKGFIAAALKFRTSAQRSLMHL